MNPATGKRSVTFRHSEAFIDLPVTVSCGQCVGCRHERSRQWAVRCVHEAQLHQDNSFVTLTYDDEHLPFGGTLIKKHFQDFMKRVRRKNPLRHKPQDCTTEDCDHGKIQYFHCGEYGEEKRRPHYHALLFGLAFDDQLLHSQKRGLSIFTSETLSDLWGMGFATVGPVTYETAAYTARYIVKKITGAAAAEHYQVTLPDTGEVFDLLPEYVTMSLKPAIAKDWYREFSTDVYPDDFVVIKGQRMKPPKYYDKQLELAQPGVHVDIKRSRAEYAATQRENATPERLAVRKAVAQARFKNFKRDLE